MITSAKANRFSYVTISPPPSHELGVFARWRHPSAVGGVPSGSWTVFRISRFARMRKPLTKERRFYYEIHLAKVRRL